MSIGNKKSDGNKSYNTPYQRRMLLGEQLSYDELVGIRGALGTLITLIEADQDYEAKLVIDQGGVGETWLEVRIWNPDTQTWETPKYARPGDNTFYELGDPGGPIAPLVYINPNTYLAQIVSNTTGIALESTLQSVATSANNIDNSTISIDNEIQAVNVKLTSAARTPNAIRTSASGNVNTVAATFYSVSVANVGTADGTILGGTELKSGEIINFDSGSLNNTFNSFAYDATGTEFIITFIS